MAIVRIVDEDRTLRQPVDSAACLASIGIEYERWEPTHPVAFDASSDEITCCLRRRDSKAQGARRIRHRGCH